MKWETCKIADLGQVVTGSTPPTSERRYYGSHCPLIKPTDMASDGFRIRLTEESLSQEGFELFKNRVVPPETACVVTIGTIGKMCLTKEASVCNQAVNCVVADRQRHDPYFVFYLMKMTVPKVKFLSSGTASGRENVSKSAFEGIEVKTPPLTIQRRIGSILRNYDELIENSQRRIRLLEAMARALYREGFVHFRFPGHEKHPRVSSPLGDIPKGWEVGSLDDVLVLQRGFDLPKADRVEGTVPIYAATGVTGFHNKAKVKAPGVVTGRSGTIGDVIYVQEDFWPLNTALWVKEFPKSEPLYAYHVLSALDLKQFNSGAAVPTLNRNDIHGFATMIPPRPLQKRFQEIAGAMLKQTRTLELQIQNLHRTRDLLLPRLLSGQVELKARGLI